MRMMLGAQRSIGNRAAATMLAGSSTRPVQRACACGGTCSTCAPTTELGDNLTTEAPSVQARSLQAISIQREDPKDPGDLTGTNFEKLDPTLQTKLKDKSVFDWGGKTTLAEALNEKSNEIISVMARVGAAISATAPFLWGYVARIGGGGITDNFRLEIGWTSGNAVGKLLAANPSFCKDNPKTAMHYHGTTDAYRYIPGTPGAATIHVITGGNTEVHIDAHQPVEGKEEDGSCNYNLLAWMSHAVDVMFGGGASGTPVARYGAARNRIKQLREHNLPGEGDQAQTIQAEKLLDEIVMKVQKYAALGAMNGDEFQGDMEMKKDAVTMGKLIQAEGLIIEATTARAGGGGARYAPPRVS